MHGKERFNQTLSEWLFANGAPTNAEPMQYTIARAKDQILHDVRTGIVPHGVKSFSELHDYVDANGYGDAFEWPDLPSESEDDAYAEFLDAIQNPDNEQHEELLEWVSGKFDPEAFDPAAATKAMKKGLPDWRRMV